MTLKYFDAAEFLLTKEIRKKFLQTVLEGTNDETEIMTAFIDYIIAVKRYNPDALAKSTLLEVLLRDHSTPG